MLKWWFLLSSEISCVIVTRRSDCHCDKEVVRSNFRVPRPDRRDHWQDNNRLFRACQYTGYFWCPNSCGKYILNEICIM